MNLPNEEKICPKCGAKMTQEWDNEVLCTYPPQYVWYWFCGCGHRERGGVVQEVMETSMDIWKRLNNFDIRTCNS